MTDDDWDYNAPKWKKQLIDTIDSMFNTVCWFIAFILNVIGFLFLFDEIIWRWYIINVENKVCKALCKAYDKIREVLR